MFAFLSEEFCVELFFESLYRLGESGLGEEYLVRGFGEIAFANY